MAVALAQPAIANPASETAAPAGVAVSVSNVSRVFDSAAGPVKAVSDFSLEVRAGEFLVIVGPSGCGKTTLLRMIADLEQPTSGAISVAGTGDDRTRKAMVFQGRSVFPWLSVADNVGYGLKLSGVSGRVQRETVDRLLNLVGLSRFRKSYPHQLSEGMRQRVAIARALAVNPQLLLMDEPFGALDEQTRYILQEELLKIWEQTGKTVILVTHSIDEALTLADRVVVMSAHPGTIKKILPVPFSRPRNQDTVRSDPQFAKVFAEIWDLLREEVRKARIESGETAG